MGLELLLIWITFYEKYKNVRTEIHVQNAKFEKVQCHCHLVKWYEIIVLH